MKKIFESKYWLFFLLFPFFNPNALKFTPGLTVVYNAIQAWKLIACCCIVFLYLYRGRLSKIVAWIMLFEAVSIFTSLLNGVWDSKVFTNALIAISLTMVTDLGIRYNAKKYYKNLLKIITPLILINFVLCLIYPSGLKFASLYTNTENPMYFLGEDNGMVGNLIPFLFLISIYVLCDKSNKEKKNGKSKSNMKWFVGGSIISFLTILIVGSATGIFTMILFIGFTLIYTILQKRKISYKLSLAIYMIFFAMIVVMQSSNVIVSALTILLGRSMTFTGRSLLWQTALEQIMERPIIGYGYTSGNIDVWGGSFSSHNMFLELALQGGIIYLAIFLFITYRAIKRLSVVSVPLGNALFLGIYCFLIKGLMETGISPFYFILLVMAYYAKDIKEQLENGKIDRRLL